jgi:hypothetical protein
MEACDQIHAPSLVPLERALVIRWTGGCAGRRKGRRFRDKENKHYPFRESYYDSSVVQPVADTNWGKSAVGLQRSILLHKR